MKGKKVCILKQRLNSIGGLEKATRRIIEAFIKKGCKVTLCSSDLIDKDFSWPISFVHLPCNSKLSLVRMYEFDKKVRGHLRSCEYDLVLAMDRTTSQSHLRLGNGVHKAYLKTRVLTDSFLKQVLNFFNPLHMFVLHLEKKGFSSPDFKCAIANSQMVKDEVLSYYGVKPEMVHVIHNGVEYHEMQKDFDSWVEKKTKLAISLHQNLKTHQFLFIGNGYKRKGLDVLLKALHLIKDEDFHLNVLGKEKNIGSYIDLADRLGIREKVTFFGLEKEVRKFYQLCDTVVIPSFYDPFANVTTEALAMGLFVISSDKNGGKEILTKESGVIVERCDDPKELVVPLKDALKHPKTWLRSQKIRESVKHLDFSLQNGTLVDICIKNS